MDKQTTDEVRRVVGVKEKMNGREGRNALKWMKHVERMSGEQLNKIVYVSEAEKFRDRDRPYTSWLDGVETSCGEGLLKLRDANVKCMDMIYGGTL